MELPRRKQPRLKNYDYSTPGAYFITICTQNRRKTLSSIDVGAGVPDGPKTKLSSCGNAVDETIRAMAKQYDYLSGERFVKEGLSPVAVGALHEAPAQSLPLEGKVARRVSRKRRDG